MFCLEYEEKLVEYKESMAGADEAFAQIKSPKILRTLEYILAVGNYINNPTRKVMGFKFSSLMKLIDVKSKTQSGVTLLHAICSIIEEKEPELLGFIQEVEAVSKAESNITVSQAGYLFMKKSASDLRKEISTLNNPEDEKMKKYFQATLNSCDSILEAHEKKMEEYQQIVESFGEQSSNDIAGFFANWKKFISSFTSAVKYNNAVKKKQETKIKEEKKLELRKKKLLLKAKQAKENAKQKAEASEQQKAGDSSPKGSSPSTRKQSIDMLVNDIVQGDDIKVDLGVRGNLSALQSSDAYSRLRGQRNKEQENTGEGTAEVVSTTARRQLKTQQSTMSQLSRRTRKPKATRPMDVSWD